MQLQMGVSYSWNNPKNAVWLQHFCVDCNYWMILMQPWSKFRSYLSPNYTSILTCYWMPAHSCRYTYTHTQAAQWHSVGRYIGSSEKQTLLTHSLPLSLSFSQHLSVCLCISVLHRVPLVATLCGILFIYVMLALLSFCIYKIHTQTHTHTQSTHSTKHTTQTHVSQGYR